MIFIHLFQTSSKDMLFIKIVISVLLTANLGHNFPVDKLELSSIFDRKRCPPFAEICPPVTERHEEVPDTTTEGKLTSRLSNTTNGNGTPVATTAPSFPNNHSTANNHRETNTSSVVSGADLKHLHHLCPIGIWVCRRKRALRTVKGRARKLGFASP